MSLRECLLHPAQPRSQPYKTTSPGAFRTVTEDEGGSEVLVLRMGGIVYGDVWSRERSWTETIWARREVIRMEKGSRRRGGKSLLTGELVGGGLDWKKTSLKEWDCGGRSSSGGWYLLHLEAGSFGTVCGSYFLVQWVNMCMQICFARFQGHEL